MFSNSVKYTSTDLGAKINSKLEWHAQHSATTTANLVWGDGASHAMIIHLRKYLALTSNIYKSFRNIVSTQETWHTKSTDLNSCASNHYGPVTSKDPSSLSRRSTARNMKRPTDLKNSDSSPPSATPEPLQASDLKSSDEKDRPKIHKEVPGFDDVRVLIQMVDRAQLHNPRRRFGRILKILKIFIFTFMGTLNQTYMGYMLDLSALLEFECSPKLKETLLNNWLVNLVREIGKWIEGDLMQEHFNWWLEDMTISPNVQHFLKIKEDIESVFKLKCCRKSHASPHLSNETRILLCMYKEEELHLFRPGHTMGHVAVNRFDCRYRQLAEGKMAEFLECSGKYSDIVHNMEKI
ncbi:hypothetical protein B0H10DRAFT_1944291 [Mycena sp. CBHHK59/15]|nr:hypothetical protein B0H10DRAFT_1944291 [Mycena sp. CBHHK59/15]